MDTEIWPCTLLSCTKQYPMTRTACWEKGVGSEIFVLVRCMYGLLRSTDYLLPGRCRAANRRSQVGRILFTAGPD